MKIHLVTAEHFEVPGLIQKAFATEAQAVAEAVEITNLMLKDSGWQPLASPVQWQHHVERLQDEHGAQFCYVEISEIEVAGGADPVRDGASAAVTGPYHGPSIADQLRLVGSLAGTDDRRGHQDQRDAVAYVETVTREMLAALNLMLVQARSVLDTLSERGLEDVPEWVAAADAAESIIAKAEGRADV